MRDGSPGVSGLSWLYGHLLEAHGPQGWWPGGTRFEVAAGAVLVQATRWENAQAAVRALLGAGLADAEAVSRVPVAQLERLLRPAGFFRQKARRLRGLCGWLVRQGGFDGLAARETGEIRSRLLALEGIGPETADCILLYALDRPVFVADAYARRLFSRLGWWRPGRAGEDYESLRASVEAVAPRDPAFLNELHALIVAHGKHACRARPVCGSCGLAADCPAAPRADPSRPDVTERRSSLR